MNNYKQLSIFLIISILSSCTMQTNQAGQSLVKIGGLTSIDCGSPSTTLESAQDINYSTLIIDISIQLQNLLEIEKSEFDTHWNCKTITVQEYNRSPINQPIIHFEKILLTRQNPFGNTLEINNQQYISDLKECRQLSLTGMYINQDVSQNFTLSIYGKTNFDLIRNLYQYINDNFCTI